MIESGDEMCFCGIVEKWVVLVISEVEFDRISKW